MTPILVAILLFAALRGGPGGALPPILDHRALLERQHDLVNRDWPWYEARIPFWESPDSAIDATYYYRWQLVTAHLTYGSPATGYTFTEFFDRPSWSGAYGAISCPLGHQLDEIRWLDDRRIVDDFARYWFETPGAQPRSYSNWYGAAVWGAFLVNGDRDFLRRMLPHMEAQYAGWMKERWDSTRRMFHWDGLHDGMEVNINARQTSNDQDGADGFRPTLNSYLYGDARAIAAAATLLGDPATARAFTARAADLKAQVQRQLWDPSRTFFFHMFAHDEGNGITAGTLTYQAGPFAGNPHGREEIGYVPWQFDLPDSGYSSAWRFVMDTAYFAAPFGPTTVERHDPQFRISPRCCVWSGNEWPYATTQTLVAMRNLLDHYHQSFVDADDWFRLFRTYTLDQRKDGVPYIAEAANPDNGSWSGHDTFDHSEHYFHSGYTDLVITGLAGIQPRADDTLEIKPLAPSRWDYFALDHLRYHGHLVAVVWDRDGSRYHRGAGLTLLSDDRVIAHRTDLGPLNGPLGAAVPLSPITRPADYAANNGGGLPMITTSYSAPGTSPHYLNDGQLWYGTTPPHRWTTTGSPHSSDWIEIDFGAPRPVDSLTLALLDDSVGVTAPLRYEVAAWQGGRWVPVPGQRRNPAIPAGRRANVVAFPRLTAARLRVTLVPKPGRAVGLTELAAWGPPGAAPAMGPSPDLAWGARVAASFTSRYDHIGEINDGIVAFSHYSRNRWTAYGTPNATDWVEIDFPAPHRVARAELSLWGDGGGVKAPRQYLIQRWDGSAWVTIAERSRVPAQPEVNSVNTVELVPVTTDRIRVLFTHDLPAATGVTELRLFEDAP